MDPGRRDGARVTSEWRRIARELRRVAAMRYRNAGHEFVHLVELVKGRTPARQVGWLPFLMIIAAVVVLAASGITWVTSPYWTRTVIVAAPRNVGIVPVQPGGSVAAYVAPIRIELPTLDTVAPIIDVSTLPGGELDVPLNPKVVGWWQYGAKPGASKGTAILDGHINYAGVEGALARIGSLNPGDPIYIYGMNGTASTRLSFRITGVRTYDKQRLPYQQIFDQNSVGRIALVTCGGPFDASTGNYLDNIVAFAVPA